MKHAIEATIRERMREGEPLLSQGRVVVLQGSGKANEQQKTFEGPLWEDARISASVSLVPSCHRWLYLHV